MTMNQAITASLVESKGTKALGEAIVVLSGGLHLVRAFGASLTPNKAVMALPKALVPLPTVSTMKAKRKENFN